MFQEQRPTCVTVIGWAWIVLGSLMVVSSIMAGFVQLTMWDEFGRGGGAPFPFSMLPLLIVVQLAVAVGGVVSGVAFLRLKAWARTVLEVLAWLLLVGLVAFTVVWMVNWIAMNDQMALRNSGFASMGIVMGIVVSVVYGGPLVVMLVYLRGPKVRGALAMSS